jgi:hypothetical protein
VRKVAAAYNWGQGNVDRKGLDRAPAETRGYMDKIVNAMNPISTASADETPWKAGAPQTTQFKEWKAARAAKTAGVAAQTTQFKEWKAARAARSPQTEQQLDQQLEQQIEQQAATEPSQDGFAHKAGVAARGAIEGFTGIPGSIYNASQMVPGMITDFLQEKGIKQPLSGIPQPPRNIDTEQFGTWVSDKLGLSKATEDDKILYPVSKFVGGFAGPAKIATKFGPTAKAGAALGGNSLINSIIGATVGTTASQAVKDSGGSELAQLWANIGGNMATGGVLGIAKGVGRAGARAVKSSVGAGVEGVAGRLLTRAAGDEAPMVQNMLASGKVPTIKNTIKGYAPTSSEIAGNAGISTIMRQTGLDANAATELSNRVFSNTKAITDSASRAAGSGEKLAKMQAKGWDDVEQITVPMRNRNLPVDLAPVKATLDSAIAQHSGNKAITSALEKVKADLPENAQFNTVYNFKQGLDEALRANPMQSPDIASLQRAKTALQATKKAIADTLTETEPGFNEYLKAAAINVKGIKAREAAGELLDKLKLTNPLVSNQGGGQQEVFGLSNQKLASALKDKKLMATLSPAQRKILEQAKEHLSLGSRKGAGSMVGSSTAQNLSVQSAVEQDIINALTGTKPNIANRLAGTVVKLVKKVPIIKDIGSNSNTEALTAILTKAELDPKYAAKIMKKYGLGDLNFNDAPGRAALRGVFNQLSQSSLGNN